LEKTSAITRSTASQEFRHHMMKHLSFKSFKCS
jgi:hypothetical protein